MVDWSPVVATLGFTALIVAPIIVNKIIKFKLEIARINSETTLKAEEIRANNQFEIEKMIRLEGQSRIKYTETEVCEDSPDKIRRRA